MCLLEDARDDIAAVLSPPAISCSDAVPSEYSSPINNVDLLPLLSPPSANACSQSAQQSLQSITVCSNAEDAPVAAVIRPISYSAVVSSEHTSSPPASMIATPASTPVSTFDLPAFTPAAAPSFVWGNCNSASICESLKDAYDEVVHWKKNCFKIPLGSAGKSFAAELSRLYTAFADSSALSQLL